MPLKSILVPLNAVQSDRGSLDLALTVARPTGAHIRALFVRPDPRDAAIYGGFGAEGVGIGRIMDEIDREGAELSARARKAFETWCARNDISERDRARAGDAVSAAWHEETGPADRIIARLGGLSDLIVEAGLNDSALPLEQTTIEASLFGSARPVLVAPKTLPRTADDVTLIAWNGSREANRAVGGALELLARCAKTSIFCEPEGNRPPAYPSELIEFLRWHGIAAQHVAAVKTGKSTGADLLETAGRERASLLVMGAYTHGRFREMVLGGVTDHVLRHAAIPVLLAH
jgi:nucleotide-binding universal stress UspA family protein